MKKALGLTALAALFIVSGMLIIVINPVIVSIIVGTANVSGLEINTGSLGNLINALGVASITVGMIELLRLHLFKEDISAEIKEYNKEKLKKIIGLCLKQMFPLSLIEKDDINNTIEKDILKKIDGLEKKGFVKSFEGKDKNYRWEIRFGEEIDGKEIGIDKKFRKYKIHLKYKLKNLTDDMKKFPIKIIIVGGGAYDEHTECEYRIGFDPEIMGKIIKDIKSKKNDSIFLKINKLKIANKNIDFEKWEPILGEFMIGYKYGPIHIGGKKDIDIEYEFETVTGLEITPEGTKFPIDFGSDDIYYNLIFRFYCDLADTTDMVIGKVYPARCDITPDIGKAEIYRVVKFDGWIYSPSSCKLKLKKNPKHANSKTN